MEKRLWSGRCYSRRADKFAPACAIERVAERYDDALIIAMR
jgi:hypothetical protein